MNKKKFNWLKTELIVAFSAILISLCSLVVSIYESSIIREHQRASVWPNIDFGKNINHSSGFTYIVKNSGIGPAKINYINFWLEDELITSYETLVKHVSDSTEVGYFCGTVTGVVLLPSEIIEIFGIKDMDAALRMNTLNKKMSVELSYCSIYDECWVLNEEGRNQIDKIESDRQTFLCTS